MLEPAASAMRSQLRQLTPIRKPSGSLEVVGFELRTIWLLGSVLFERVEPRRDTLLRCATMKAWLTISEIAQRKSITPWLLGALEKNKPYNQMRRRVVEPYRLPTIPKAS